MTVDPKAPVREGDVVAGKYRIERPLGAGGMGVVMAARHLALGEPVALKFVTDGLGADREVTGRMMREARATFRLRSEHTVRVLDVGELPSGPLYIVMELLDGRDLRTELKTRGALPEAEVVRHALQACDALEEAHALGIVHRDLKPHNMFLARSPRGGTILKILDFGMSKVDPAQFDADAAPLTRPETALGTPRYMAPEQWKSAHQVDSRADIWALGVVMYEMLTGEVPVSRLRGPERLARLLAGAIEDPRTLRPDLSEALARVVLRCLRADPAGRWPTIAHLRTALVDASPARVEDTVPRAEVTRTDVTRAVPEALMKQQAQVAFADAAPTDPQLPDSEGPPTRPATPAALQDSPDTSQVSSSGAKTEIRPPIFTPTAPVVASGPSAPQAPAVLSSKPHASTLRSAASPGAAAAVESMLAARPQDRTVPMANAPPRPVLPTVPDVPIPVPAPAAPAPTPAPPSGPASFDVTSVPRRRMPPRTIALIAGGAALMVCALGAIGWLVANMMSH